MQEAVRQENTASSGFSFMKSLNSVKYKRALIFCLFIAVVSVIFWTTSRYPQLQGKASLVNIMSETGVSEVHDTIAHRRVTEYAPTDSFIEKVKATAINWYAANRKGMSFGVVIGAAFLCLFRHMRHRASKNNFINSFFGMLTGAPLGICSNCVAPVARGIFQGGSSVATALSMMFSSPTLNIVVLTIMFTSFPLNLALIKIGLSLALILVIVPLLARQKITPKIDGGEKAVCELDIRPDITKESWGAALIGSVKSYGKNFFYLAIRVVPLMILAGLFGAIMSHAVDFTALSSGYAFIDLVIAAFVGTFLPIPMAVDVMIAQSLTVSGVATPIISTLLFTLGSYSIYSFMIVYNTFGAKIAFQLYGVVATLGMIAGALALL